jgi:AcrR family transcriptional regulator
VRDSGSTEIPWWSEGPKGRGRPREPVTQERIVAGAVELLKTSGLDALSMRKLAAHVGVSLSTVYAWVGSKERLLAWIADSFYGSIPIDDIEAVGTWKDQLRELAVRSHTALRANPALTQLLFGGVLAGPSTLRVVDRWDTILLDAGFDERETVAAQSLLAQVIVAAARSDTPARDADLWIGGHRLDELPPAEYPGLTKTAREYHADDRDARFRFAIETVLDGLDARLAGRARQRRRGS